MTAPTSPPPNAIDWQNLINAGHDLLNPHWTGTQPTDEHIRRAISNAYYALFHALAASNAETLVGTPYGTVTTAAWSRVYRGLDHGLARRELQRHRHEFSAECQKFVDTFGDLQNLRHSADYDHKPFSPRKKAQSRWQKQKQRSTTTYRLTATSELTSPPSR